MGNKQNTEKNSGTEKKKSSKTCCEKTLSFFKKRIKRYWPEMIALILFGGSTGIVHFLWEPFDMAFLERDPRLSLPYIIDKDTRLPIALIIFLVIGLPILLTFTLQMLIRFWRRPEDIHPKAIDPFYGVLIMGLAMAINGFFSEFIKSYVGKKRPNFFAMCNYKGYRDALASNNFTYYLANTNPNVFGNLSDCWDNTIFTSWQSRSSYPSGHASYSFCGYTIFGLLSIYVWHCITKKHKALKVIYFLCLMIIALIFSWSRVLDYWHDNIDIFTGAALGGVVGSVMFLVNFSFSTVDKLKKEIESELKEISHKEKSHKRKSHKRKSHKRKSHKEKSHKEKSDQDSSSVQGRKTIDNYDDENTSMLEENNENNENNDNNV